MDESDPLMPSGFVDGVGDGIVDLPFESCSADPQSLEYADLPGPSYDPAVSWRDAQKAAVAHATGEFGPEDQEATGG